MKLKAVCILAALGFILTTNTSTGSIIGSLKKHEHEWRFHFPFNFIENLKCKTCTTNAPKSNIPEPNAPKPNTVQLNTVKPNTVKPNTVQPNTVQPNIVQPKQQDAAQQKIQTIQNNIEINTNLLQNGNDANKQASKNEISMPQTQKQ